VLDHLPGWYQQSRINLGLDLRGGAHFLLEADLRSVLNERLTNLSDSVRGELRKQQVPFKDITVEQGRAVNVVLRDETQRAKAIEAIRNVAPPPAGTGTGAPPTPPRPSACRPPPPPSRPPTPTRACSAARRK